MDSNIIIKKENCFFLNTLHTTYAFRVNEQCGALEHLYYGRRIHAISDDGLREQHAFAPGNAVNYAKGLFEFSLEDMNLEMSTLGKGDFREPMVEVVNSNGSNTLNFKYKAATITEGKQPLSTLPSSYSDNADVMQLNITMSDDDNKITLNLVYSVFADCDVITRSASIVNNGDEPIRLTRMLSNLIDFDGTGYVFTTFRGAWAREMKKVDTVVSAGKLVNSSYTGTSSSHGNPFVMMSDRNTTEDHGECYGFNLVYSGNHYEVLEVSLHGKTRFVQGINPQNFEFILEKDDVFEAPEAVMTFSYCGYNMLSEHMHSFVNEHIVRGAYKYKPRPVLLNSWEAAYFDINKSKLKKLAKTGKSVGIELFVVDDGWFGARDDDTSSLGDWDPHKDKLPDGLKGLCDSIKSLGLDFGIWVEPEMVNVNSNLYREHPDWTIDIPDREHSEGRNQRILDLTRTEVQDFIIDKMTQVFESADISYVKWDMNRNFSDVYSRTLPANRQGEVFHRYCLGLYRCMGELTKRFPNILFEGCAAGGNRFDLGILSYFPQIWASDDTDPMCRAEIQNNYTYGYPQSVISAHVSSAPNHQTLRKTPIETRYHVASFGVLGYECNLCDMKNEKLNAIKKQIELYKEFRELFQYGQFYRGRSYGNSDSIDGSMLSNEHDLMEWTIAAKDKKSAVGMLLQKHVKPNTQHFYYKPRGLNEDGIYRFTSRSLKHNIKEFGDLVNTISPIHIKQDSLIHNVAAHFVKMDSAMEDYVMYGDAMMYAGVKLKQAYGGTGYNENVRYFQDFSSEMFFMQEINEQMKPSEVEETEKQD